ncbi:MAG: hypothetical protein ACI9VN_003985 [Patescibacteria group bacterium]|jgi:hypothetical protein
MKILIALITILPLNLIFAQYSCCELIEKSRLKLKCFTTTYNSELTNYSLIVIDTISKKPIFEYDYKAQNPFLNLEHDFFNIKRKERISRSLQSFKSIKKENSLIKKDTDVIFEDPYLRMSRYTFKDFEFDTIPPLFKEKVHQLGFSFCTERLNFHVESHTVYLQENRLESIVRDKIKLEPYGYTLIQNKVILSSCTNTLTERRLDVVKSNGQLYSIVEVYDPEERPDPKAIKD